MVSFELNPQNVDDWCGPEGSQTFDFRQHSRVLNAQQFELDPHVVTLGEPIVIIPREQWPDLIADKDRQQSWLYNVAKDLPCKDQDGLGYCHAYWVTHGLEIITVSMGYSYAELSAESIGGPVTGWRNAGANPSDDLEQACKVGACLASYMDRANSITPRNWTAGWEKDCANHRVEEYDDLNVGNDLFAACMSAAFVCKPYGAGFPWWSHIILGGLAAKYDAKARAFSILHRNSWGADWGENGFSWMREGYGRGLATPGFRVYAPRLATSGVNLAV